ncbi:MAG: NifB/NifX family molybdenum-iron cluster-binding protein [Desulfurivibrio sp.]|nr:NifB/NifX family molybdenum-iron cluster-binding protein [Desulfurivibrio sp.]
MKRHCRLLLLLPVFCWLLAAPVAAGPAMIVVTAEAPAATATVSTVAARSPYLLFFDGQGHLLEALPNPQREAGGNAGPALVEFLAARGVQLVIAGEFGNKMVAALQDRGIEYQLADGKATAAVQAALAEQ